MFSTPAELEGAMPGIAPAGARKVVARTSGRSQGAISRLIDPEGLGRMLKPFVFLDYFDENRAPLPPFGLHPHSGIATLTYVPRGAFRYEDTSGAVGLLEGGGVEWIEAGSAVWHQAQTAGSEPLLGFQLWIALPPELELGAASSRYVASADIATVGPVRVLLGHYAGVTSAVQPPSPLNYLAVKLQPGERWIYQPPPNHSVLWAAVSKGTVLAPERIQLGELVAFEPSSHAVEFSAEVEAEFVLGSARPHPHELVLGPSSVHTTPAALNAGLREIAKIAEHLRRAGSV